MEYIFTNLPQYIKTHDRSVFESSVVKENHVLLFSEDGETLTAKLPDGSFQAIGGGGETSFYQCASVDADAGTWTGYKWRLDSEEGIYELEEELTTDELTITGFEPVVGYNYSADTLIMAGKLYAGADPMPTDGLVFHASLASNAGVAETGQELTEASVTGASSIIYQTFNGVPCAYFGGENNLTFVPGENFPTGSSARSISLWVYMDNTNDKDLLFFFGDNTLGTGTSVGVNAGKVAISRDGVSGGLDGADIQASQWYHLAAVKDTSDTFQIYIDGIKVATTTGGWENSLADAGFIGGGKRFSNTYYLTGYLAGIRVYNRALTMDEIGLLNQEFRTPFIDIDDTLSLTFKRDEAVSHSLDATDSLGNACSYEIVSGTLPAGVDFDAATGTFSGTPTVDGDGSIVIRCYTKKAEKEVTVTVEVKENVIPEEGLVFHAPLATDTSTTTGQIITGTPAEFVEYKGVPSALLSSSNNMTAPMTADFPTGAEPNTISCWVCCEVLPNPWCMFFKYGAADVTGDLCSICINDANVFYGGVNALPGPEATKAATAGSWYHLACTYDGTTAVLYVNGEQQGSVTVAYAVGTNGSIDMGSTFGEPFYLAGCRVYNRALTADEITELYNEFTPTA